MLKRIDRLVEYAPSLIDRLGFARHKVLIKVVPIVVGAIALRVSLELGVKDFTGLLPSSSVTPFATASMFIIAILLSGVLEDFKEGEVLPMRIVNVLGSLSDKVQYCAVKCALLAKAARARAPAHGGAHAEAEEEERAPALDSAHTHFQLLTLLANIMEYLAGLRCEAEISSIVSVHFQWLSATLHPIQEETGIEVYELGEAFDDLREALARMAVIKRTTFIPSGYGLMQFLVYITILLTAVASYPSDSNVEVPEGGGGRRLAEDGGVGSSYTMNIGAYSNVIIYAFLFHYVLCLIDDLEDPFEVRHGSGPPRAARQPVTPPPPLRAQDNMYALLPKLVAKDGRLNMNSGGSADVDVFPLLELYARLAALAGLKDIVGPEGGLEARFSLIGASGELLAPSAVVTAFDDAHMKTKTLATRDEFREILMDSTYSALSSIDADRVKGGGGTLMSTDGFVPSHDRGAEHRLAVARGTPAPHLRVGTIRESLLSASSVN